MDKLLPYMPIIWLALAVILGIGEAVSVDLVAIRFAVGSVVAILPAALGAPFWFQVVTFFAVSTVSLAITRPLVKKVLLTKQTATNADLNIGKIATVIQEINNHTDAGRVHLEGLDWSARSEDGEVIPVGERVLVKDISGVKLIVERIV